MNKSIRALTDAYEILIKTPLLLVPAVAPIVIHLFFLVLAYQIFPVLQIIPFYGIIQGPNLPINWGGYLIASVIGFMASCIVVDMTSDLVHQKPLDLNKSLKLIRSKLDTLIISGIIVAVCFVTFILIPVALFIIVISILENTDAITSTKKSIALILNNLEEIGTFLVLIVLTSIIFGFGFGIIPIIGIS